MLFTIAGLVCIPLFTSEVYAADSGVAIPFINGIPSLADFSGMSPASELARSMARIQNFIQREPDDGAPASQRTEVYLSYDEENLYSIFLAFDDEPEKIRSSLTSRENFDGDDTVQLTIDTFNNQISAYAFRVNPNGIQWDARWTESSSFRRSSFDTSLEAVWESEGQITDQGYMVRMTIPLRSLRFADTDEQVWRIQVTRMVERLGEESHWPAYSIDIDGRLNQAALLTGISNVSPGNNSQIVPFVFAREREAINKGALGGPQFQTSTDYDVGIDAKFVFNDSMILDMTLNPDFSQVESDEPQVTINERFEVEFPERRPYFMENANFFATDTPLVFTRRIIDPEAGIRFTGRSGNIGFGAIITNDVAPGLNRSVGDPLKGKKANIGILRGFVDVREQDRIGFLISDRELADGYNRVASFDTHFRPHANWSGQAQFTTTDTLSYNGDHSTSGHQENVAINHTSRNISTHTHYVCTTENFYLSLGFLNRYRSPDTCGIHNRLGFNFFPEPFNLNRISTTTFHIYLNDLDGNNIYNELQSGLDFVFDTTTLGGRYYTFTERLKPKDFPGLVSNRQFDYEYFSVNIENNTLDRLEAGLTFRSGTALNMVPPVGYMPSVADTSRIEADLLWRPLNQLRVANTYFHTDLKTKEGSKIFSNEIIRSNWNYQFNKEWSLRFIAQYEETKAGPMTRLSNKKSLNFDILLRYVINPWSAFYAGYNTNESNFEIIEDEGQRELVATDYLKGDGDQIFVKFSYLFQR